MIFIETRITGAFVSGRKFLTNHAERRRRASSTSGPVLVLFIAERSFGHSFRLSTMMLMRSRVPSLFPFRITPRVHITHPLVGTNRCLAAGYSSDSPRDSRSPLSILLFRSARESFIILIATLILLMEYLRIFLREYATKKDEQTETPISLAR